MEHPPTERVAYQQDRLFPPRTVRIEIVLFLDGPTESSSIGWKMTDADDDDLLDLGATPGRSMNEGIVLAFTEMARLEVAARAMLSPF